METIYDLIILGAGPAGLAAGLYGGRYRLNTLLVERGQDGGQIAICRLPRYLTKPRQRRSEWDMAGSDGISRVSAVFRGKSLLTNKMRII